MSEDVLVQQAAQVLSRADAVLVGASNGLSIAEGYHLFADNEMFRSQFGDLQRKYGFRNVLEGCFFPYPEEQDRREFLRRLVQYWVTDYRPTEVMRHLLRLVGGKDYFVLTSNADTHLELSGFEPARVFELEGTFEQMARNMPVVDRSRELHAFLDRNQGRRLVVLELGIGRHNRLIKLPLMQLVAREPKAVYITLNLPSELYIPQEIASRSIGLAGDLAQSLRQLVLECENKE